MNRIKQLLVLSVLLAGLSFAANAQSATATLLWDTSPTAGVTYRVYTAPGATGGTFVVLGNTPSLSLALTALVPGSTQRYYVVAVLNNVESDPTPTLVYIVPPAPPTNLRITRP